MQSIYQNESEPKTASTGNFDFSLARCKVERLAEAMNEEKAMAILKIPTGRSGCVHDRSIVDNCFKGLVLGRVKIDSCDPSYLKKIENRYVLES